MFRRFVFTGAIAGAVHILACNSINDIFTAAIASLTFVVLWLCKVPKPVVAAGA